jgi:hypothetical protein
MSQEFTAVPGTLNIEDFLVSPPSPKKSFPFSEEDYQEFQDFMKFKKQKLDLSPSASMNLTVTASTTSTELSSEDSNSVPTEDLSDYSSDVSCIQCGHKVVKCVGETCMSIFESLLF